MRFLTFVFLFFPVSAIFSQQQHISHSSGQMTPEGRSRNYFEEACKELEDMLEGRDSLDYERAVFLTENAYWDNQIAYSDFQNLLDLHTERIRKSASTIKEKNQQKYATLKRYEKKNFHPLISNAAIYHYLTSPQLVVSDNNTIKIETLFRYSQYDPYGTDDWTNSQVLSLLNPARREGNCYAWTALFKIFSERLKSEAFISTAPHHVYIQHKDIKGGFYNVELPTRTFPGDGTIETLTYTTREGIMSGIAMRKLNLKESIGLCLIYLAKGYEYKFGESDAYFSLRCSNLALKHDSLNLNAMLLKAGVMEESLVNYMKKKHIQEPEQLREIAEIKDVFSQYEKWINRLNALGYREIPSDVQDILLAKARGEEISTYKDRTPEAFPDLDVQDVTYITLSNGLFDEVHVKQKYMSYGRTVLDTETGRISEIVKEDSLRRYKVDPVVFALSVDPLTSIYPMLTPYQFASNTPIQAIDLDGLEAVRVIDHSTKTTTILINVVYVPNSIDNPNSGSGFSQTQINEIEAGVNNQILQGSYTDNSNKDSDGKSYKVNIQINFVQATSMEDAKQIKAKESDRTVLLEKGQYKVSDDRKSITLATTGLGVVRLNSSSDSHTNTHEIFHSIVHFSKNTPNSYWDGFSPNDQGPWHAKFGGIFQYQDKLPISQENIDQALQATPLDMEIPAMGPYTPVQQSYIDKSNKTE